MKNNPYIRRLSVAPMMDCTDRHYRQLMRCITRHTLLYTEMLTAKAIIHGDRDYLMQYDQIEHPVALQLGGSDPAELAKAAKIGEEMGYDEINLNVGCPSDRVQSGMFGACLMKFPELVVNCVKSMRQAVDVPVTIKTRLGVDELDSYDYLAEVIGQWQQAGCETFIIHARKAWLKGLSPRENREVPPLHYDRVYRLKRDFSDCHIGINGGIKTLDQTREHLQHLDEVMIGREAYSNPYLFSGVDNEFYNDNQEVAGCLEVVGRYLPYVEHELKQGTRLRHLIRPLIGLFQGMPGARRWRRYLSEHGGDQMAGTQVIETAQLLIGA
ncbi:MAG: tRNA dihydrouridine(20/20a) synthase DusA [Coxiellaceae bacterium]|nr:tRNA dihydrouridine(20/20a) synthase DusA [Coxiellaceae bacterium]